MGNLSRVKHWFDESGTPRLGDLDNHYPDNDPRAGGRHFDVSDFLLEHGADINTGGTPMSWPI